MPRIYKYRLSLIWWIKSCRRRRVISYMSKPTCFGIFSSSVCFCVKLDQTGYILRLVQPVEISTVRVPVWVVTQIGDHGLRCVQRSPLCRCTRCARWSLGSIAYKFALPYFLRVFLVKAVEAQLTVLKERGPTTGKVQAVLITSRMTIIYIW